MRSNKNKKIFSTLKILNLLVIISIIFANFFIFQSLSTQAVSSEEVNTLNAKISAKKKSIDTLQKEIEAYKENIKQKQGEAKTLKNQIAILENQIAKLNLDIQATQARIDETNLEIQALNFKIKDTENQIADRKTKLGEYINILNKQDQVSYLEVLLLNENFSDFFDQMRFVQDIHSNVSEAMNKLKEAKLQLDQQKVLQQEKIKAEELLKDDLSKQKDEILEKSSAQEVLLLQTKLTERQYQQNMYQLQVEQQQINADISTMEKTVRAKLEELQKQNKLAAFGPTRLDWPINPSRGVSAYFHDVDYPFRYIYEHPGIDIRAGQGTPIKAPDDGYIGRVKFNGDKSYAYLMVLHNDGLSTVFGHITAVYVKEDTFVRKGEIIALSGGRPGSVGAGNMTTGPHLHFEVRLNGIPVNPLDYLPSL